MSEVKKFLDKLDKSDESATSDKLAKAIDKSSSEIDDSMSVDDLARAVGKILRDSYGSHNYDRFNKILSETLKRS